MRPAPGRHRLAPTELEIAAGRVLGEDDQAPALAPPDPSATPLAVLERAIAPLLERTPCLVTFSGGRDSAAVLATATSVARREGLPTPVPITMRFPDAPETEESGWQEEVVRHLRLDDWQRLELTDELDYIGDVAADVLRRHGVLWPPNVIAHARLLREARGGVVMTGVGGDDLFATWTFATLADALAGRRPPQRRDLRRLAFALAPPRIRRWRDRARTNALVAPWLRKEPRSQVMHALAAERASEPFIWNRWLAWWLRRRLRRASLWSLDRVAEDTGAHIAHPLLDPAFVAVLGHEGGRLGLGDRTRAMRALFARVLPDRVLARPGKAIFYGAFWGPRSEAFASGWNGSGIDSDLVDRDRLRRVWLGDRPPLGAAMLLQAAWLGSATEGVEESLDRGLQ